MALKPTLNQADVDFLKTELASEIVKLTVPEVVKAVIPQIKAVVSLVITKELSEQEERYEKKLDEFKSDFFDKVDPVLKEVTTAREARTLIENRIEALEEIHQTGKHSLATP